MLSYFQDGLINKENLDIRCLAMEKEMTLRMNENLDDKHHQMHMLTKNDFPTHTCIVLFDK